MTGTIQMDGVTYAFLASVMAILLGGAIWGVKRFVEASDRLKESMESIEEAVTLLRLTLAEKYPTKEDLRQRFDEHLENFHRG